MAAPSQELLSQEQAAELVARELPGFTAAHAERHGAVLRLVGQAAGQPSAEYRAVIDDASARLLSLDRFEPDAGRLETVYRRAPARSHAHRGAAHVAPENTLAAIDAAIALGAAAVEIDVRATADGHFVLLHDPTLERTTDGEGPVAELSLVQVKRLDAGSWLAPRFAGERVPTLEEALERIGTRASPDIDFKAGDPAALVARLRERGLLERSTFYSGDLRIVRRLRELAPELRVRPTVFGGSGLAPLLRDIDPPIVNIDWPTFSEELIREVHLAGKLAFVNTMGPEDGPESIRRALAAGADFVQSDQLETLVELVAASRTTVHPGRSLLDAHNAYPEHGKFEDRLGRALAQGLPLAVEQDLCWYQGGAAAARSIVAHGPPFDGHEPDLAENFFEPIRSAIEEELRSGDPRRWPIVVLNLDFKEEGDHREHHRAMWDLLGRYEAWLTVADRRDTLADVAPLQLGPLLVLTGASLLQQESFHDALRPGERLRLFGAALVSEDAEVPPPADNYRRWINYPWRVVEQAPQPAAGELTLEEEARLAGLVRAAHQQGLWIRFYTLNGHPPAAGAERGWLAGYNFGSLEAVRGRWQAALRAGVDFVATDQYEELAALRRE